MNRTSFVVSSNVKNFSSSCQFELSVSKQTNNNNKREEEELLMDNHKSIRILPLLVLWKKRCFLMGFVIGSAMGIVSALGLKFLVISLKEDQNAIVFPIFVLFYGSVFALYFHVLFRRIHIIERIDVAANDTSSNKKEDEMLLSQQGNGYVSGFCAISLIDTCYLGPAMYSLESISIVLGITVTLWCVIIVLLCFVIPPNIRNFGHGTMEYPPESSSPSSSSMTTTSKPNNHSNPKILVPV